ncbi:MAG: hypothetical protein JXB38_15480 [Anaerolineales bacterium]|nr:hypothetical protein [Anaerolineales bacterium]
MYFQATDGTNGSELWVFDCLSDTVSLAVDIYPGSVGSGPSSLTVYDHQDESYAWRYAMRAVLVNVTAK